MGVCIGILAYNLGLALYSVLWDFHHCPWKCWRERPGGWMEWCPPIRETSNLWLDKSDMRDCSVDLTLNIRRSFLFPSGNGTDLNNLCPGSNTRVKIHNGIPLKSAMRLALGLGLGLGLISLLLLSVAVVYYDKNKLMKKKSISRLSMQWRKCMLRLPPLQRLTMTKSMPTSKIIWSRRDDGSYFKL